MEKIFSDSEFILYAKIQSFFYRCWVMFGDGQDIQRITTTNFKYNLMKRWAESIFVPVGYVINYNIEIYDDMGVVVGINREHETNHYGVRLMLTGSNRRYYSFEVDVREPLESNYFYNIKWVDSPEIRISDNTEWKKIPKVWNLKRK